MYYRIFQIPLLNFIFRTAKAIPIASARENEDLLNRSFDLIDEALNDGNIVCIFPEGGITFDGDIQRFRPGIEKSSNERRSRDTRRAVGTLGQLVQSPGRWRSPQSAGKLFARVDVRIGEAVSAAEATAGNLEILVRTLRGDRR